MDAELLSESFCLEDMDVDGKQTVNVESMGKLQ